MQESRQNFCLFQFNNINIHEKVLPLKYEARI